MAEQYVLDNFCWHALNSDHAHLAGGGVGLAKRYRADVSGASALAEHSEAAYHDLTQIVDVGETTALFEANPPQQMPGWTMRSSFVVDQLICQRPVPEAQSTVNIIDLNATDVPEIMPLIALTRPGPFFARTIETGRYIGIRQGGALVAMAGQRHRFNGYCEISSVCTHPDWQGKGYARVLTSSLVNMIWEEQRVPFLHVFSNNTSAYRLYESLNFSKRCEMTAQIISRA
ncbi:MAG: GNAT family N-acetyltransferase [Anaerolineae bacterium]